MARRKLPEYIAKKLLFERLELPYHGIALESPDEKELRKLDVLDKTKSYVVKVDQGVKKRGKQGLVGVKVNPYKIKAYIKEFTARGYSKFLVEDFVEHEQLDEKYFALERTREGIIAYMSQVGGMDIEENQKSVEKIVIPNVILGSEVTPESKKEVDSGHPLKGLPLHEGRARITIATFLGVPKEVIQTILKMFEDMYMSFLEINPLVVTSHPGVAATTIGSKKDSIPQGTTSDEGRDFSRFNRDSLQNDQGEDIFFLDLAVEVDSAGEFFVKNGWSAKDFVDDPSSSGKTEEEKSVRQLKENSQASLKLDVLNPNGSIFTMLSGGGASITLADETYNRGYGKELANYADYSGNPNAEEMYLYTKQLLGLLHKSSAPKKVLLIAGGVANFTDVRITFRGILKALQGDVPQLQKDMVKIFVRRGGPNQAEGLRMMQDFLLEHDLYGGVWDNTMVLTDVVNKAIEYIR